MPLSPLPSLGAIGFPGGDMGIGAIAGGTAASAAGGAVADAAKSAASSIWDSLNITRIVIVILGLLFVAAGIFSIQKVQEVTGAVARTAAVAA